MPKQPGDDTKPNERSHECHEVYNPCNHAGVFVWREIIMVSRMQYERRRRVWRLIENQIPSRLTPEEKAILVMFYHPIVAMSDEYIAQRFNKNKSTIARTRQRLIKSMLMKYATSDKYPIEEEQTDPKGI